MSEALAVEVSEVKQDKENGRIRRRSSATPEIQAEIKEMHQHGDSINSIVLKYNIYQSIVEEVLAGTYVTPDRLSGKGTYKKKEKASKPIFDLSALEKLSDAYAKEIKVCEDISSEAEKVCNAIKVKG